MLNFPSSPVDGQVYDQWVYSSAKGAWLAKPLEPMAAVPSPVAPLNPTPGDMWFNTVDGTTYVWYDDGNTSQWVEMVAPITANGYYSPNYVINGAFDINQRGFTSTTTNGAYGFDRWRLQAVGGTVTYSSQNFTPGNNPAAGNEGKSFARIVTTDQTSAYARGVLEQRIENVRLLAGKAVTVSFWARSISGTPGVSVELVTNMGTGGSPSAGENVLLGKVTLNNAWTRYSVSGMVPSLVGKTLGTDGSYLTLNLWVSAGSDLNTRTDSLGIQSNTFDFWGVQLEEGSVATPFRRNANSLQGELAACQRYYWRSAPSTYVYQQHALGVATGSTICDIYFYLPVPMRARPTSLEYSNIQCIDAGFTGSASSFALGDNVAQNVMTVYVTGSGYTQSRPAWIRNSNNVNGYIGFNAEL